MSRSAILALQELDDTALAHRLRRAANAAGNMSIEHRALLEIVADRLDEVVDQLLSATAQLSEVHARGLSTAADIADEVHRRPSGTTALEVEYRADDLVEDQAVPYLRAVNGGRS